MTISDFKELMRSVVHSLRNELKLENKTVLEKFSEDSTAGLLFNGQGVIGQNGADGANATINGLQAINIESGTGINMAQSGSTLTLSTNLGYLTKVTLSTSDPTSVQPGELVLVYE